MVYKSFDENITRKHGIVVEGWPLTTFENPSSIGSQVELKVLLNAWQSDVARFHKMSENEFQSWNAERHRNPAPPTVSAHPQTVAPALPNLNDIARTPPSISPPLDVNFIQFHSAPPTSDSGVQRKPRKTRSDKGKPRKRLPRVPGETTL
jgi:hypothetical protein